MNPYTNILEVDEYLKERLENLPIELRNAVQDQNFFEKVTSSLKPFGLGDDIVESIRYEVLLILMRITPQNELASTLVTEFKIDISTAVEIANTIDSSVLQPYKPLLTNIPDDEETNDETQSNTPTATISPVQAMENDVALIEEEEPIIQASSQDALLRREPQAPVPSYDQNEAEIPSITTPPPPPNAPSFAPTTPNQPSTDPLQTPPPPAPVSDFETPRWGTDNDPQ